MSHKRVRIGLVECSGDCLAFLKCQVYHSVLDGEIGGCVPVIETSCAVTTQTHRQAVCVQSGHAVPSRHRMGGGKNLQTSLKHFCLKWLRLHDQHNQ